MTIYKQSDVDALFRRGNFTSWDDLLTYLEGRVEEMNKGEMIDALGGGTHTEHGGGQRQKDPKPEGVPKDYKDIPGKPDLAEGRCTVIDPSAAVVRGGPGSSP